MSAAPAPAAPDQLMIPGPVALSPAVLAAMGAAPQSHTAPPLIEAFARLLAGMRTVWGASRDHQPFAVAGSGTVAMEIAATNVLDPGQWALVLETGVFGDRMARILERRGVNVRRLRAPVGRAVTADEVKAAFAADGVPDALFVTHVDTSTGVRCDLAAISAVARAAGPLLVVDGVCSVGGERCPQAAWGIDVLLTASQKALSAPPGLAMLAASPRAMEARRRLHTPPPLSMDLLEWLPISVAYAERRPSYFATPPTGLIAATSVAVDEIVAGPGGVDGAVARHTQAALRVRAGLAELGLRLVPVEPWCTADTLSAVWLPEGAGTDFVARVARRGVLVAGGLHPEIRTSSFRIGHMGWTASQPARLAAAIRAVGEALVEIGHPCAPDRAAARVGA